MRPLDSIDLHILSLLYQDARTSNKQIAEQVGMAASSCLERIKRLQHEGILLGSQSRLRLSALGGHIQAMVAVRLSVHKKQSVEAFQQALLPQPEVLSLFHMGGENDFLVHVSVVDASHLRDFVLNQIAEHSGVNHVETTLVYEHQISHSLPSFPAS